MEKKLHCGDLFKRVLSLAMALVMLLSFAPVPHAHAADATYIVAGVAGLCGSNWNGADVNNQMTLVDGLYTKTFVDVPEGDFVIEAKFTTPGLAVGLAISAVCLAAAAAFIWFERKSFRR